MNPILPELRFLRPYLCGGIPQGGRAVYRSFASSARRCEKVKDHEDAKDESKPVRSRDHANRHYVKTRMETLRKAGALNWPRIDPGPGRVKSIEAFKNNKKYKKLGQLAADPSTDQVRGKLRGVRTFSRKLMFLDLEQNGHILQVVVDASKLLGDKIPISMDTFAHTAQRGDYLSVTGNAYRTKHGTLSLRCVEIPRIISPSLAPLPAKLEDQEVRIRNRHVDMLVNPTQIDILRARYNIIGSIRHYMHALEFVEVSTPLIVEKASGAIAKPFVTNATEFPEKQLALRIAPEIWLKRLIIGGMERVFEIGPAFRNEGLDGTHNPEFTTCEFYQAYIGLERLMGMTETLFYHIQTRLFYEGSTNQEKGRRAFNFPQVELGAAPWKRIAFIPAIEEGLGQKLPDLESPDAEARLIEIFNSKSLPLPTSTTLPRLLDKLSAIYIEPQCAAPTFITHHPALMSPLAKSYLCPLTNQLVSARAELFIQSREMANMYEEENSPIDQREKFLQQQRWKDDENEGIIDESYLEALEWGLPPTGGWGCGVDRIVMLFTGARKIGDVLAFGSLRNVVNLGAWSGEEKGEEE